MKQLFLVLYLRVLIREQDVYAADDPFTPINMPAAGFTSLSEIFPDLFSVIMTVGALILLFNLFVGGFKYLLAGSNDENVKKARATIMNAVIGMFLLASVWAFWSFIVEWIPGLPELLGK